MKTSALQTSIVLAGGFGTRLRERVSDRPKALAPTGAVPFVERQLAWLEGQGIARAILAVHYLADQLEDYVRSHYRGSLEVALVREPEVPLGTGGAVKNAFSQMRLDTDCLVVNGDTAFSFSLTPVMETHCREATGATMTVARVGYIARYGSVRVSSGRVTGFEQATGVSRAGWVNCGAYILSPEIVATMPDGAFSSERDFFPQLATAGRLAAHSLPEGAGFIDIGTPESYDEFCEAVGGRVCGDDEKQTRRAP